MGKEGVGLVWPDNLVLYGMLEEGIRLTMTLFAEVSKKGSLVIYIYIYIYMDGGVWVQLLGGVRWPVLVLFLFYVKVSGMRPWSRFSSKPLTIPVPWVFLRVVWSISLVPP